MEFQYQDVKSPFTSPDYLFNYEPAGQIAPKINAPPPPNSIENLTADYLLRQRQVADAVVQQHKIDNIYERVVGTAPSRNVEVLPPENPADVFDPNRTKLKNITPVEQQQEITELLEKQVKRPTSPPNAAPPNPLNPRTYPLSDPMATPPTAMPRQPIRTPNPAPTAQPSSFPVSAGRIGLKAIGVGAELGFRVAAGQSPTQAAAGTAGGAIGSFVGGALGAAIAGPLGGFVGGVVGSYVGGAIADELFRYSFPPTAQTYPDPLTGPYPFNGGQLPGILYRVRLTWDQYFQGNYDGSPTLDVRNRRGPIQEINLGVPPGLDSVGGYVVSTGVNGEPIVNNLSFGFIGASEAKNLRNISVEREDGLPDGGQNPPPYAIPDDFRTPQSLGHPGNSDYGVNGGMPGQKRAPGNVPGGTDPRPTPRGDATNWMPHGSPAPKKNPNPNTTPSNLGGGFPQPSPNPAPNPTPYGSPTPGPNPEPPAYRIDGPSGKPVGPSAGPGTTPSKATPNPLPNLSPKTPPGDAYTPAPNPNPNPDPTSPNTNPNPQGDICESPCIKSMGEQITQSKIFWIDLEVPIVVCTEDENGVFTPKRETKTVKVIATSEGNEVLKTQIEFETLAGINERLCNKQNLDKNECYTVVPEWWQVRVFQRPQLVIQYAELLENNKIGRSRWAVSIPHYNKPKTYKPGFLDYDKGDFEGILVLNDNSKIIINAKTKPECLRVIEHFKQFIDPKYLENIQKPKIGERPDVYKKVRVTAVRCHFFSTGQKQNPPDWSLKLRESKKA